MMRSRQPWPIGKNEPDDWDLYKFDDDSSDLRAKFLAAGRQFLPDLQLEDLQPDYVGVRAKLFKNHEPFQEFVLERSAPNTIHCLGIESPGVTAALAIAEDVSQSIK